MEVEDMDISDNVLKGVNKEDEEGSDFEFNDDSEYDDY